jgi:hypothetical protein
LSRQENHRSPDPAEIIEQDDAYGALGSEEQDKLDQQIAEVAGAYEEAVKDAVMEAAHAVQEAICEENANLLEAMRVIREQWGDDAVEGALEMDSGMVACRSLDVSLALDPDNVDSASLKLDLDLSCTIKQAESIARMQGALQRQSAAVPDLKRSDPNERLEAQGREPCFESGHGSISMHEQTSQA